MKIKRIHVTALALFATLPVCAIESAELFENEIRPIFSKHCYECHSTRAKRVRAGLFLDSRQGRTRGGESGSLIIPSLPDQSLLMRAVRYTDSELRMPPSGQLSGKEIANLERWIKIGADSNRNNSLENTNHKRILNPERQHWAFQALRKSAPPEVRGDQLSMSNIDRFIIHEKHKRGLESVSMADQGSLLRRVSFDLLGLPPSRELVNSFRADVSPQAYEKIVDYMLASPRFGERWGRHWLDVARFADSVGSTKNMLMRQAWRYRDYVIDSFNIDKPYDQFVREQVAGDLLPASSASERNEKVIATGFLTMGARSLAEQDPKILGSDEVAEQIDTLGRAFLGLSLSCSRCHDHKFAPISTKEFYALAGIFQSTQLLSGFGRLGEMRATRTRNDLLHCVETSPNRLQAFTRDRVKFQQQFECLTQKLDHLTLRKREIEDAEPFDKQELEAVFAQQRKIREEWAKINGHFSKNYRLAMGVADAPNPVDARLEMGGDPYQMAGLIPRGFLKALHDHPDLTHIRGSGRLELAKWLTESANPLLARVAVNRIWRQLMGKGLVATVDDYTYTGVAPTHPFLLDFLAIEFIKGGYSVKSLIRSIVLSRVYQASTDHHETNYAIDPDNLYYWRMDRRRLELEPLRDAMLAVTGDLDTRHPPTMLGQFENQVPNEPVKWPKTINLSYRTVYLPVLRNALPAMYHQFDFPPPDQVIGARSITTVPTQALFLMNSKFVLSCSIAAAKYLVRNTKDPELRIANVYLDTIGRLPTVGESERISKYIAGQSTQGVSELEIWEDIYHIRFSSAEFIHRN